MDPSETLPAFVCAPWLHAEMIPQAVLDCPGGAVFNPGLAQGELQAGAANWFSPADLPLDPRSARRVLAEMLEFGRQAARPSDLAVFSVKPIDDNYSETVLNIDAEMRDLSTLEQGVGAGAEAAGQARQEAKEKESAFKAQQALLLAWQAEEHIVELMGLENGLGKGWQGFENSLGLSEEGEGLSEEFQITSDRLRTLAGDRPTPDWKNVLAAMARFLPLGTAIVACRSDMLKYWQEQGLDIKSPEPDKLPPGLGAELLAGVVSEMYWRLIGLDEHDPDLPWLDRPVVVFCLKEEGGQ
ncbi:MAG: hypothetical protein D6E12_01015 [Desulfovibrio sp.]|nr:MAG: hypothetical protein D6E12_01015 [Desulfovibrio sp.]